MQGKVNEIDWVNNELARFNESTRVQALHNAICNGMTLDAFDAAFEQAELNVEQRADLMRQLLNSFFANRLPLEGRQFIPFLGKIADGDEELLDLRFEARQFILRKEAQTEKALLGIRHHIKTRLNIITTTPTWDEKIGYCLPEFPVLKCLFACHPAATPEEAEAWEDTAKWMGGKNLSNGEMLFVWYELASSIQSELKFEDFITHFIWGEEASGIIADLLYDYELLMRCLNDDLGGDYAALN